MADKKDNWERFIDSCVADSEIKECKDSKGVRNVMLRELKKAYKGKASLERIKAVADDATESICLRLNLPQIC